MGTNSRNDSMNWTFRSKGKEKKSTSMTIGVFTTIIVDSTQAYFRWFLRFCAADLPPSYTRYEGIYKHWHASTTCVASEINIWTQLTSKRVYYYIRCGRKKKTKLNKNWGESYSQTLFCARCHKHKHLHYAHIIKWNEQINVTQSG